MQTANSSSQSTLDYLHFAVSTYRRHQAAISSSPSFFCFLCLRQVWQVTEIPFHTPWYEQESGGGHYCPQITHREQVPEARGKRPCALPPLPPGCLCLGVGMGFPTSPTNITELPGLGTIPPSCNGTSNPALMEIFSSFSWFITDSVCKQGYAVTAFYHYCFPCNFLCFKSKNPIIFLW